jgi:hypothetical protein
MSKKILSSIKGKIGEGPKPKVPKMGGKMGHLK